jgi:hypothetical protein
MSFFLVFLLLEERWIEGGGKEGKRWSEEKGSKKTLGRQDGG